MAGDAAADSRDLSRYLDQTQKSLPLRKGEERQRRLAEKKQQGKRRSRNQVKKKSLKKVQYRESVSKSSKQGTTKKKRSRQDFFSSIVYRALSLFEKLPELKYIFFCYVTLHFLNNSSVVPDSFVYSEPAVPGMHSRLSLFGASEILVDFQRGDHEEVFTPTSADGPVLEFDYQGAKTDIGGTVIDLVNLFVKLDVKLRYVGQEKAEDVADLKPTFVNNLMHSLFQNVEISLSGTPLPSANNLYPFKTLVEAELSHNASCKEGWLRCQGYEFETDPGDIADGKAFTNRQKLGINLTTKFSF